MTQTTETERKEYQILRREAIEAKNGTELTARLIEIAAEAWAFKQNWRNIHQAIGKEFFTEHNYGRDVQHQQFEIEEDLGAMLVQHHVKLQPRLEGERMGRNRTHIYADVLFGITTGFQTIRIVPVVRMINMTGQENTPYFGMHIKKLENGILHYTIANYKDVQNRALGLEEERKIVNLRALMERAK